MVFFDLPAQNAPIQAIINDLKNKGFWHILPPQKAAEVSMYRFESKLQQGEGLITPEYLFYSLQQFLRDYSIRHPEVLREEQEKTKDVFIGQGRGMPQVRATYLWQDGDY